MGKSDLEKPNFVKSFHYLHNYIWKSKKNKRHPGIIISLSKQTPTSVFCFRQILHQCKTPRWARGHHSRCLVHRISLLTSKGHDEGDGKVCVRKKMGGGRQCANLKSSSVSWNKPAAVDKRATPDWRQPWLRGDVASKRPSRVCLMLTKTGKSLPADL